MRENSLHVCLKYSIPASRFGPGFLSLYLASFTLFSCICFCTGGHPGIFSTDCVITASIFMCLSLSRHIKGNLTFYCFHGVPCWPFRVLFKAQFSHLAYVSAAPSSFSYNSRYSSKGTCPGFISLITGNASALTIRLCVKTDVLLYQNIHLEAKKFSLNIKKC